MRLVFFVIASVFSFETSFAIFKASRNADSENDSYKVFNGFASMRQLPYAVKIFSRENQQTLSGFSCSGSIVHQLWIVTAAHCVYGFKVFDVFIGNVTNDVNHVVRAAEIFIHPNYTFEPELSNDIALMKLKRSLETLNNSKLRLCL
jgi:secreted trypsin-like serine protease